MRSFLMTVLCALAIAACGGGEQGNMPPDEGEAESEAEAEAEQLTFTLTATTQEGEIYNFDFTEGSPGGCPFNPEPEDRPCLDCRTTTTFEDEEKIYFYFFSVTGLRVADSLCGTYDREATFYTKTRVEESGIYPLHWGSLCDRNQGNSDVPLHFRWDGLQWLEGEIEIGTIEIEYRTPEKHHLLISGQGACRRIATGGSCGDNPLPVEVEGEGDCRVGRF